MGKLLEALMQPFTCIAQLLIMLFICARFRHVGDDQISYLSGLFMREWSVPAKVLQAAVVSRTSTALHVYQLLEAGRTRTHSLSM